MSAPHAESSRQVSLLRAALAVVTLALSMLLLVKYEAFRSDHQTQLPMLMMRLEPGLFARDWFFAGEGQSAVRQFFLTWEQGLLWVFRRIELALFAQFLAYLAAVATALRLICSRLGRGWAVTWAWALAISGPRCFGVLGGLGTLENQTIPRMYPYAGILLAIPLLMGGHAFAAGFLLGLLGLLQPAPALQFLPLALVWCLVLRGWRRGWRPCLALVGAFVLSHWPQVFQLRDLVAAPPRYPPEEVIRWLAAVRHPHHMLPRHFPVARHLDLMVLLALVGALRRTRGFDAATRPLGQLVAILTVYLLAAALFIEVIPVALWIAFQPFRLSNILVVCLLFFVADHLVDLLRSGDRVATVRGLLIAYAVLRGGRHGEIMRLVLLIEAGFLWVREWVPARHRGRLQAAAALAMALVWFARSTTHGVLSAGLCLLLILGPDLIPLGRRVVQRLAHPRLGLAAALVFDVGFLAILLLWPFRSWDRDPREWSSLERLHFRFAMDYQVYPFPSSALERAAAWARDHTPPEALFVIPPARESSSFHIWSRRAIVFNVKFFPYAQREWPLWIERYFAHGGVLDPAAQSEAAAILAGDVGGDLVGPLYEALPPQTVHRLATRYGADHVVAPGVQLRDSPLFETVGGPFIALSDLLRGRARSEALHVFRVR